MYILFHRGEKWYVVLCGIRSFCYIQHFILKTMGEQNLSAVGSNHIVRGQNQEWIFVPPVFLSGISLASPHETGSSSAWICKGYGRLDPCSPNLVPLLLLQVDRTAGK